MALVNVDLAENNSYTIDENNADTGVNNDVNVTALSGSPELIVDGVDATLNSVANVTAASSPTFTATNGGNLTINEGLLDVSLLNNTTFNVDGASGIALNTSSLSLLDLGGLDPINVQFSGDGAGTFSYDAPSLGVGSFAEINVSGATAGDTIELAGESLQLGDYDAEAGTLNLNNGNAGLLQTRVDFNIEMTQEEYDAWRAGRTDAEINADLESGTTALCFAAGTMIASPDGEVAVETLSIGDSILTASGKTVAVKWIGRQTLRPVAAGEKFQAVRVREGALGDSKPNRDLVLTAGHGLILDDLVIDAGVLVNHSTIEAVAPAELPAVVTYYHVETEGHEVILANGTEAETYVDYIDRQAFDNYAEYVALYGNETRIVEMPHHRISSRRLLPLSVRQRLGIEDPLAALTA